MWRVRGISSISAQDLALWKHFIPWASNSLLLHRSDNAYLWVWMHWSQWYINLLWKAWNYFHKNNPKDDICTDPLERRGERRKECSRIMTCSAQKGLTQMHNGAAWAWRAEPACYPDVSGCFSRASSNPMRILASSSRAVLITPRIFPNNCYPLSSYQYMSSPTVLRTYARE